MGTCRMNSTVTAKPAARYLYGGMPGRRGRPWTGTCAFDLHASRGLQ